MTADRRDLQQLGEFLRARRQQVDPAAKGLPVGRRRTPGLRREEVAILASISPSWYTYLEQGRDIRPSEAVLDSLADVLDLSQAERRYLHLLALGGAPHRDQPITDEAIDSIRQLLDALGPLPAYAGDQRGDVVGCNDACREWLVDFDAMPGELRNSLLWMVLDPRARERFVDWEREVRDLLGRVRAAMANDPQDPRIRQLIGFLQQAPDEVRGWWDLHEVSELTFRTRLLRHPVHGVREFRMMVLLVGGADQIGVLVHVPVGDGAGPAPR
jgi:transcriptional regulator with XRE-family HTH domain